LYKHPVAWTAGAFPAVRDTRQETTQSENLFFEFGGNTAHELLKLADKIVLDLKTGLPHGCHGIAPEEPRILFRSSNPGLQALFMPAQRGYKSDRGCAA